MVFSDTFLYLVSTWAFGILPKKIQKCITTGDTRIYNGHLARKKKLTLERGAKKPIRLCYTIVAWSPTNVNPVQRDYLLFYGNLVWIHFLAHRVLKTCKKIAFVGGTS